MAPLRKSLLAAALLTLLALAAALAWREVVVEAAARFGLSAGGLGDASFEVVEVGWTETVIEHVALGPGLPAARRVRLVYAPGALVRGHVGAAYVEGLNYEVPADWRAARARLESLASGEGDGWLTVSRVALADAVVTLAGRDGRVSVDGALDLSGEGTGAALEVDVALAGAEGAFTVRSDALGAGGVAAISGRGAVQLAGLSLPGWPGTIATGGHAEFSLEGTAPIPAEAGGPRAWLDARLALAGDLRLNGVATATSGVLSADVGWSLSGTGDSLRLALKRAAQVTVADLPPGALAGLPVTPEGAPSGLSVALSAPGPLALWSPTEDGGIATFDGAVVLRARGATASVRGSARLVHGASWRLAAPAELAVRAEGGGWSLAAPEAAGRIAEAAWEAEGTVGADGAVALRGPLSARIEALRLAGLAAESGAVDGALAIEADPGRWSLRLDPGATLVAAGVEMPGTLRIDERVTATLDRLALSHGDAAPRLDLAAALGPVAGTLFGGGDRAIPFADAGGRVTLDLGPRTPLEGELRVEGATVALPREAVRLDGAAGSLRLGAAGAASTARLEGEVRDTGPAARIAPLRVALEAAPEDGRLSISGTAETLDGALRLPLSGAVDLAAATARVSLGPARVTFREGGLQPGALGAALAVPGSLAGGVGISGDVALGPGGKVHTRLTLALEDLAMRGDALEVAGLSGRVTLSGLAPPASAGPQELAARSLVAGVPIGSPRARFTILPRSRGVAVQIHEGTGTLAGGEVAVAEARWDTAAESNTVDIRVRDVSIERLLTDWQIEGISGTGRLSGEIPVRVGPAGVVVEAGRLEAAGGGRISVDWGGSRETLVHSGEQVALTVRALEDFRYEALSIGVERPADGALSLAIALEGANPEVLDGYPFRFNITLSGRLEPILAAIREGRRIGADLLRGGLGAGP